MARILFLVPVLLLLLGGYFTFFKCPPTLPQLDVEKWWGPQNIKTKADNSIRPFKIKFQESLIHDLRERIREVRPSTAPLEGIGFEYGFNTRELDGWLQYWTQKYNFAKREKFLNQFPSYKTNIQGLDIHYIHVKPEVPKNVEVVQLLMIHGWPGSIREFYEAIPLLTTFQDGQNFAVEVIVPSLPGYGFCDATTQSGLGAAEIAVVLRNLMHRLDYKNYYVQGGDWGGIIGDVMATLFSEEVLGFHTNMASVQTPTATAMSWIGSLWPAVFMDDVVSERMYPLSKFYSFLLEETGYLHIQASKPDTIGVALSDSPAGLLAYILEKFSTWTDRNDRSKVDGGLSEHFSKDQLIDNLMFYWATNSMTTSMRLYAETFNMRHSGHKLSSIPTQVPTWVIQAKYEISYQTPFILKSKYPNLLNNTVIDDGGHFLALQLPKVFAEDVLKAIERFRVWHKENGRKTEL